jgi:hypothetical protein
MMREGKGREGKSPRTRRDELGQLSADSLEGKRNTFVTSHHITRSVDCFSGHGPKALSHA